MSWSYRVIKTVVPDHYAWYTIEEVYYSDDPTDLDKLGFGDAKPYGDDISELRGSLELMLGALKKPALVRIDGKIVDEEETTASRQGKDTDIPTSR